MKWREPACIQDVIGPRLPNFFRRPLRFKGFFFLFPELHIPLLPNNRGGYLQIVPLYLVKKRIFFSASDPLLVAGLYLACASLRKRLMAQELEPTHTVAHLIRAELAEENTITLLVGTTLTIRDVISFVEPNTTEPSKNCARISSPLIPMS